MQYLIPTNRQNLFSATVIIGAIVNLLLNLVLITAYESIGAAIASVVAEVTIALVQLFLVRKELSFVTILKSSYHYIVAGGIMLIALEFVGKTLNPSIIHTLLMVIIGSILYFSVLLLFRDSFFIDNAKSLFNKIYFKNRGDR